MAWLDITQSQLATTSFPLHTTIMVDALASGPQRPAPAFNDIFNYVSLLFYSPKGGVSII